MLTRITAVLAFLVSPVFAADLVVGPGQSIQAAIDQAVAGDRVVVLPGEYWESIDLKGKAIELVGLNGAAGTVLHGNGKSVITLHQGEGPATRIRGLTVTGGIASWMGGGIDGAPSGGPRSTALIEDCLIRENQALFAGGGVAGDFTLTRCTIRDNAATGPALSIAHTGGVWGGPTMVECAVLDNVAKYGPGGVHLSALGPVQLVDCVIAGNQSSNAGGGVYVAQGTTAAITRCVIAKNHLEAFCPECPLDFWTLGSGVYAEAGSSVIVESSTVVDNSGTATGPAAIGQIVGGLSGPMTVTDSIVRGNTSLQLDAAAVAYSDVEGGAAGPGNFDADPLVVDALGGDYHLAPGSPCIDAGTPGKLDPDGSPLDVGAFPFGILYTRRDLGDPVVLPGWSSLPADLGGVHPLRVHPGSASALDVYFILGSATGTAPGVPVLGATLPLVPDGWLATTAAHPDSPLLVSTLGLLDPSGTADAWIVLPPGFAPPVTVWHAALILDPSTLTARASAPVELRIE